MRDRHKRRWPSARPQRRSVLGGLTMLLVISVLLCYSIGQLFLAPPVHKAMAWPAVGSMVSTKTASTSREIGWSWGPTAAAVMVAAVIAVGAVARRATLKLFSPAKVNTFLKITGRTEPPNPMHTMVSQFHTVSLGDWMKISTIDGTKDTLQCDDPSVPTDDRNLVLKAFELFRQKTASKQHFSVILTKRCPNQAGLGGGSSNGATALWAANRLTHFGADDETLARWSRELGSDLPFFLASHGAALCSGVGDEVFPMTPEAIGGNDGMVFVKPPFGLPTPAVYKEYAKGHGPAPQPLNDLTRGAVELRPELLDMAKDMEEIMGLKGVSMSGSGSCLFGYGKPNDVEKFKSKYPGVAVWPDIVPVFRKTDEWYSASEGSGTDSFVTVV